MPEKPLYVEKKHKSSIVTEAGYDENWIDLDDFKICTLVEILA